MNSLDLKIFHAVNGLAKQSRWLDYFGIFCGVFLIWLMAAASLLFFFQMPNKNHLTWLGQEVNRLKYLLTLLIGAAAAYGANMFIGLVFAPRVRPYLANIPDIHQLISTSFGHKSFPSSHATVAFALAFAVFLHNRTWGILMLIAAVLVALGRVYVGVHYPTDVLAGAVLGMVAVYVVYRIVGGL